jgi:ferric-dicitrate binding protein FerR (iron transport regulator)
METSTMTRSLKALALAAAVAVLLPALARAEEKFLGTVTKIDLAGPSATSAVATLKAEDGSSVDLYIDDKITLDKFKDKRISPGDEIKAKYEAKGGKKHATFFKKPGGC